MRCTTYFWRWGRRKGRNERKRRNETSRHNGREIALVALLPRNDNNLPYRLTALPPYRLTALPPYRLTALPPHRLTALPPYRLTALPPFFTAYTESNPWRNTFT